MSRQQKEEKENSGSSGKGLAVGLAVTALGVGIGTALYYFFSKDEENNHAGTSSEWEHQQAFRGRAYTLEECSICFEVMLQGEMLMGLPCTHNFHVKCISPWISEHQTCPVCREKC